MAEENQNTRDTTINKSGNNNNKYKDNDYNTNSNSNENFKDFKNFSYKKNNKKFNKEEIKEKYFQKKKMMKEEEEKDLPKETLDWKLSYEKDDLEIMYNPVKDYEDDYWVSKKFKRSFDDEKVITCAYCFLPIAYNFRLFASKGDNNRKDNQKDNDEDESFNFEEEKTKFAYLSQNVVNTIISQSKVEITSGFGLWYQKIKGRDDREYPDLIFKVFCAGCKTELGEYHFSKKWYFLTNCLESNG